MAKSPVSVMKEKFGTKDKLVKAVQDLGGDKLWIDRANEDKGLDRVSNAKLLRLHDVLSAVKDKFGSRDKLVEAILDRQKRGNDAGWKSRLERYPTPRLWDLYRSTERTARTADKRAP